MSIKLLTLLLITTVVLHHRCRSRESQAATMPNGALPPLVVSTGNDLIAYVHVRNTKAAVLKKTLDGVVIHFVPTHPKA
jgi:membrane protein CcdC involved in cytochrome C biogenesis